MSSLTACSTHKESTPLSEEELSDDVVSKKQHQLSVTFIEAISEKNKGNLDRSMSLFKQCLDIDDESAAVYFEISKLYGTMANLSESMVHIDKAIELDNSNIWYKLHKTSVLEYANLNEEAAEVYGEIVKLDDKAEYLIGHAQNLVYSGQYQKAIDVFEKLQAKMGKSPELVNQIYQLYVELGKNDKAIEIMKLAADENPSEISYQGMLAAAYEENGELEKSIGIYKEMLKLEPDNPRIHLALYKYYDFNKDTEKAFASLTEAFKSEELPIDDKMQILIMLYEETDRHPELSEKMYPLLDQLIEVHSEEAKAYSMYGDYYLKDDNKAGARDMFAKALKYDSEKFLIWNQVMFLDMELNQFDSLIYHSSTALNLFPNQPGVYYFNGYGKFKKGQFAESEEMLLNGLNILIDNRELEQEFYQTLADLNYKNKQHDKAFEYYDKVLEMSPENAYVLNNFAYYLALDNVQLEKAQKLAERAIAVRPGNASYRDTHGWILFRMGKYVEAKREIQLALDSDGKSNPVIVEHMGDVMYKLNNQEEALRYWNNAKELGSKSEILLRKLSEGKYVE